MGHNEIELTQASRSSNHNLLPDDQWAPLAGWPLAAIGRFSRCSDRPSLLVFANQSKALWRQAVFFAFSTRAMEEPSVFLRRVGVALDGTRSSAFSMLADRLPHLSPAQIVTGSIDGGAPNGLLGVLRRLGGDAMRPETYRSLLAWHTSDPPDSRTWLLQKMVSIDQDRLDALAVLDPAFWAAAVLPFITTPAAADELNQSLDFIRKHCSTATPAALRESASALSGEKTVERWLTDWLRKADGFIAPVAADEVFRPSLCAADLVELGQRFRNCIGTHCMAAAISGKLCVVEYLRQPAVAVLARLDQGHWLLTGVHAPKNRPVPEPLVVAVQQALRERCSAVRFVDEPPHSARAILSKYLPWYDPSEMQFEPFAF